MDSNTLTKIKNILQRISDRPLVILGILVVGLIVASSAALMLLPKKSQENSIKTNTSPAIESKSPTSEKSQTLPSPTPDVTKAWNTLTNTNGISVKYPKEGKVIPDVKVAESSSSFQLVVDAKKQPSQQSTLSTEVLNKTDSTIAGKNLLEVVNFVRSKNSNVKILTKPISILYGGNTGYEWYFQGSIFNSISSTFSSKEGKQRVIQFEKGAKHYIILTTFDDEGEKILSTFQLTR